jgi:hypothetical protein
VVVDGDDGGGLLAHRVAEDFTLPPYTCGSQEKASGPRVRPPGKQSKDIFRARTGGINETRDGRDAPRLFALVQLQHRRCGEVRSSEGEDIDHGTVFASTSATSSGWPSSLWRNVTGVGSASGGSEKT